MSKTVKKTTEPRREAPSKSRVFSPLKLNGLPDDKRQFNADGFKKGVKRP